MKVPQSRLDISMPVTALCGLVLSMIAFNEALRWVNCRRLRLRYLGDLTTSLRVSNAELITPKIKLMIA